MEELDSKLDVEPVSLDCFCFGEKFSLVRSKSNVVQLGTYTILQLEKSGLRDLQLVDEVVEVLRKY